MNRSSVNVKKLRCSFGEGSYSHQLQITRSRVGLLGTNYVSTFRANLFLPYSLLHCFVLKAVTGTSPKTSINNFRNNTAFNARLLQSTCTWSNKSFLFNDADSATNLLLFFRNKISSGILQSTCTWSCN